MAGMEQLEIHSKSYIVRWVKVDDGHTISWSIQPHKKSINFGIVKHPGTGSASTSSLTTHARNSPEDTLLGAGTLSPNDGSDAGRSRRASTVRNDMSTVEEQLRNKGFIWIQWFGKCEADKVTIGTHAVGPGQGGMYGLVFDNTFSKAISKTATFVLLTYPTNAPPNTTHHNLQSGGVIGAALGGQGISKSHSPNLIAAACESVDSLQSHSLPSRGTSVAGGRPENESSSSTFHVGTLMKKRRKRAQGYARRYFSLDFVSCTLSYYHNRGSSALRGAIPLSLAAIAADERRREISIDSGAEIWHLKAANAKDFSEWVKVLEKASNKARGIIAEEDDEPKQGLTHRISMHQSRVPPSEEDTEWQQIESLMSRIVGTRDAVRRLAKDTRVPAKGPWSGPGSTSASASSNIPEENGDYLAAGEKRPFWKRKSSTPRLIGRKFSSQLSPSVPPSVASIVSSNGFTLPGPTLTDQNGIHKHCGALLKDLDDVLSDFHLLISKSRKRRYPAPLSISPRRSMDSDETGEFYDAEAGDVNDSQLLKIDRRSDDELPEEEEADEFLSDDATSISSADEAVTSPKLGGTNHFFPPKPKSLHPLPIPIPVSRRTTVAPATVPPPSLISFLRKNVGKDLSTISMPVSANEPTSALQRLAESLEYAHLLDAAAQHPSAHHRHLHIAAFAVSYFAAGRAKERAIRKPFNPMLGETFELVRAEREEPGNFRFIAEKVCHRPVKLACHADSPHWTYTHSSVPTQKFWGKSAELITEGRMHVVLRLKDGTDECYSWPIATVFLRNVVMGEKYIEPVGSVSVVNETAGTSATVEFKTKGMFGGRSEDVVCELYDEVGSKTLHGLTGTWTTSLRTTEQGKAGKEIWRAGKLVGGADQRYGLTEFAAQLNEITPLEHGKIPISDSRLRPDQRAAEDGDLDAAEVLKAKLEEAQRVRRKEMDARGVEWSPKWFVQTDDGAEGGEECWKLKGGKEGYWEERARGEWRGVEDVLCVKG